MAKPFKRRDSKYWWVQEAKGLVTPWVFQRQAKRVISIRGAWHTARAAANVPGRLIHDLRRTAVRNLLALGYPVVYIKNMVGIKSDSIFQRYAIVTEGDILDFVQQRAPAQSKHSTS